MNNRSLKMTPDDVLDVRALQRELKEQRSSEMFKLTKERSSAHLVPAPLTPPSASRKEVETTPRSQQQSAVSSASGAGKTSWRSHQRGQDVSRLGRAGV